MWGSASWIQLNYLFSLKNCRPCQGLNPGPPGTSPICYQLRYPGLDRGVYNVYITLYVGTCQNSRNINFNQILTSRQSKFITLKSNRTKIGLNSLANRLYILNGNIPLDWLNLAIGTFEVKCKELFPRIE